MCFKKNSLNSAYDSGIRRCPICSVQMVWKANPNNLQRNLATVDHIIPKSKGGGDTPGNMFVMCRSCNETRGNTCFITYVTSAGISKSYAENLYRVAHVTTLQNLIFVQFTQLYKDVSETKRIQKRNRKIVQDVVKSYTDYFGDYLPEFQLLQRLLKD
jgi:hypothetical protein